MVLGGHRGDSGDWPIIPLAAPSLFWEREGKLTFSEHLYDRHQARDEHVRHLIFNPQFLKTDEETRMQKMLSNL